MSFRVRDAVVLNGREEREVVFGPKYDRVRIHPWDRGEGNRKVYLTVGDLKKDGGFREKLDGDRSVIVDREQFVEAVLAVFPELSRNPPVHPLGEGVSQ